MNSAFVLSAYFAMILSPCFVAQWGDLLSVRWIAALARRRRTHRAESFLVSFRQERYSMAVALEASFAANSENFTMPEPFLAPRLRMLMDNPAFAQARQRVAARLAQLAVAQQLRDAAEATGKVVAIPPDVAVPAVAGVGTQLRPRKPVPVATYPSAERELTANTHVFSEDTPRLPEFTEVVFVEAAVASPAPTARPHHGLEAVPSRQRKDESSGSLEVAA